MTLDFQVYTQIEADQGTLYFTLTSQTIEGFINYMTYQLVISPTNVTFISNKGPPYFEESLED